MRDPDLIHWHKVGDEPSNCQLPPECCIQAFDKVQAKAVDDAEHAERRRVVTEALAEVDRYRGALASVLVGDQAELATRLLNHVAEAVRSAGCICPMLDITTLGEPPGSRKIAGGDPRCGVHGTRS